MKNVKRGFTFCLLILLLEACTGNKEIVKPSDNAESSGTIKLVSSDWLPYTIFDDNVGSLTYNLTPLLGANIKIAENQIEHAFAVSDSKANKVLGNLYCYSKITVDKKDLFFSYSTGLPAVGAYSRFYSSPTEVKSTLTLYNSEKKTPKAYNPAVKYIFMPIELIEGRKIAIDMKDYEAVKKVYDLKD